jgi:radical SAM/Cys-rich protein
LEVLNHNSVALPGIPMFREKVEAAGFPGGALKPVGLGVMQINMGKLCNQACAHCHVDAGPDRKEENMQRATLERCLEIILACGIPVVDITGGAPEMNPNFRWFVEACAGRGVKVMNRCNLTILVAHAKYRDLPTFFANNGVEVVSSLPHYSATRTDHQRGEGVFEASIEALKALNTVGYGKTDSGLTLNLVYNPSGTFLPGNQSSLESDFKRQLSRRYGIVFNRLFAITNMPISRFLDHLIQGGQYTAYMQALLDAFNPSAVAGVMCRNMLSVGWDGSLYDCDFNQMLGLKVSGRVSHLADFDFHQLMDRSIVLNQHCYGCTAGAGSSCGGQVV